MTKSRRIEKALSKLAGVYIWVVVKLGVYRWGVVNVGVYKYRFEYMCEVVNFEIV